MEIVNELTLNNSNIGNNQYTKYNIDHTNTICKICGRKETTTKTNGKPQWCRYIVDEKGNIDKNGKWDEKSFICNLCYHKYVSYSAKYRNKQLSKDCNIGKGFIGEQIWCKVRGVKNCNIENDNFHSKYDHSPDKEYGIVNSKISSFSGKYKTWNFGTNGKYDNVVLHCMDKEWKNVERTYIIPKEVIENIKSVAIYINLNSKWEKYRVDEKPYNEAYHSMNLKDCSVLKDEDNK